MTRDEIILMAREAGFILPDISAMDCELLEFGFACYAAGAAAEREACAKVLEDWKKHNWTFEDCAVAVRARGKE